MKVRPLLRYTALTVGGVAGTKVTLLLVPRVVVGGLVGLVVVAVMVLIVVRAARACARGELESTPLFKPATPPGEGPNARVQTHTRAHPQARTRKAA